jgi:hypothetical protein
MPDQIDHKITRTAGKTVSVNVQMSPREGVAVAKTAATIAASFDSVKHLLSNKPMFRPNRTRPL